MQTDGQTDRHDETNGVLFSVLRTRLKMSHCFMSLRDRERITLTIYNLDARWGWMWMINTPHPTPPPLYPLERDLVPTVRDTEWASGSVWTGTENLALTRLRAPDHPRRT
jgi:hypothetical protein